MAPISEKYTMTAVDGSIVEIPESYICPITLTIMQHPLVNRRGHNFEREAIMSWLEKHNTCPLTRTPMRPSDLISNKALELNIRLFRRRVGLDEPEENGSVYVEDEDDYPDTVKPAHSFLGFVKVSEEQHAEMLNRHGATAAVASEPMTLNRAAALANAATVSNASRRQSMGSSSTTRAEGHRANRTRQSRRHLRQTLTDVLSSLRDL